MPPLAELDANTLPSASLMQKKTRKYKWTETRAGSMKRVRVDDDDDNEVPAPKKRKSDIPEKYNVDKTVLDGQEEETVPIYDTCNTIREKIRNHFVRSGMTQAAFIRELKKSFPPGKKLQSRQLKLFMDLDGHDRGCESAVYYGAYVYFERLRIKNGEPKSDDREDLEDHWEPSGGISRVRDRNYYIMPKGMAVYGDEFGRIHTRPEGL